MIRETLTMIDKTRLKQFLIRTKTYRYRPPLARANPRLHRAYLDAIRSLYAGLIRPGDLCFDIGAHIGRRSDAMLALGGASDQALNPTHPSTAS